jgi:cytoskeletal protein CcmA (bactofilin family)
VKKAKNANGESQVPNIIAQGTSVTGDLISNGDFRIEGTLNGTISTKGRIVIGETGVVEGDISCQNADISGKVSGNIIVEELTMLKVTSKFEGHIRTTRLAIEPGALFSGQCVMGAPELVAEKTNKK